MKDVYLNPELYDALHSDIETDENVNEELLEIEEAEDLFIYLASTDSNGVSGKQFNAVDWLKEHGKA